MWPKADDKQAVVYMTMHRKLTNERSVPRQTSMVEDKHAGASEGYTSGTHRLTYAKNQVIIREWGLNKGNNKITELRAILQREIQNS